MLKNKQERTEESMQAMLNALEKNYGNIEMAARQSGISVRTHYLWIKEDRAYHNEVEAIKDICFRNAKDRLLNAAMKKIEKGETSVLNKMLGIFLKDLPDEMRLLRKHNDVPLRASINYVPRPNWEHKREQESGHEELT